MSHLPVGSEEPKVGAHRPRVRVSSDSESMILDMQRLLASLQLHTVCESARCPNRVECFSAGTATFMILGDVCTRNCRFCAVTKGRPEPVDEGESVAVAEAVEALGLKHVVITSPTRDDLPDGGASHFARVVSQIKHNHPSTTVEVLIPDLQGSHEALAVVAAAGPDVIGHDTQTCPRLYPEVRPGASYARSVGVIAEAKRLSHSVITKSALIVGLGEQVQEIVAVMGDLVSAGCDILTVGQYLRPCEDQMPVAEHVTSATFEYYRRKGEELGFRAVLSGPLVRSSYRAGMALESIRKRG